MANTQLVSFVEFPTVLQRDTNRMIFKVKFGGTVLEEILARWSEAKSHSRNKSDDEFWSCMDYFMWFEPLIVSANGVCTIGMHFIVVFLGAGTRHACRQSAEHDAANSPV